MLGGGTIVGVRPDTSAAERAAAVKWIDFFYLSKLTDEASAAADAETLAESDAPVGTPDAAGLQRGAAGGVGRLGRRLRQRARWTR